MGFDWTLVEFGVKAKHPPTRAVLQGDVVRHEFWTLEPAHRFRRSGRVRPPLHSMTYGRFAPVPVAPLAVPPGAATMTHACRFTYGRVVLSPLHRTQTYRHRI